MLDNVFTAVRDRGDEVQLSSMFAHLLTHSEVLHVFEGMARVPTSGVAPTIVVEQAHDQGRCDIWIESPEYVVIVENKINAAFQPRQVERYLDQLPDDRPGVVVVLTPLPESYDLETGYDAGNVVQLTWSGVADTLRYTTLANGNAASAHVPWLVKEFIEMLQEEKLAAPPLTADGVDAWQRGFDTFRWVSDALELMRVQFATMHPTLGNPTSLNITTRPNLLSWYHRPRVSFGIGFQLRESRFFAVAYPPGKTKVSEWRAAPGVKLLRQVPAWTWSKWGLETGTPLDDIARCDDDQRAFVGSWYDDRIREVIESGLLEG